MREFPKPDRSDYQPQQNAHRMFYPELDLGSSEGVFKDGRPYRCEYWFDKDTAFFCRTYFYSVLGIEDWVETDHDRYIRDHGLLEDQGEQFTGQVGLNRINDASGNEMWSVTEVFAEDV